MKSIKIFTTVVLLIILYSCGNRGSSKGQKADAELYKYFSKEEINKKMQRASTILERKRLENQDRESLDYVPDYSELYADTLLVEEGFAVAPQQIETKWGRPKNKKQYTKPNHIDADEIDVLYI